VTVLQTVQASPGSWSRRLTVGVPRTHEVDDSPINQAIHPSRSRRPHPSMSSGRFLSKCTLLIRHRSDCGSHGLVISRSPLMNWD